MSDIGSGISSDAIEQDPGIAQLQAAQVGFTRAAVSLPSVGFVESINSLSGLITLQAGTSSSGVTVTIATDGVSTITIGVTGIGGAGAAPSNETAAAPTPGNDESQGWKPFSIWIDNTNPANPTTYICTDNSTAAAVWIPISGVITPITVNASNIVQAARLGAGISPVTAAFLQVKTATNNDLVVRDGVDFGAAYSTAVGIDSVDDLSSVHKMLVISGNPIVMLTIPVYANNAAAITGGLPVGGIYRTGADPDFLATVH